MTKPGVLVLRGIPDPLRPRAGELFFDAFARKLGGILGTDGRGARLMTRLMNPPEAIVALSPDRATLLGLAGLKTARTTFMDGTLADLTIEYGILGGFWRGLLLTLIDSKGEPGCLHIDALAVAPDARGQGLGTALLDACRTEATRRGLTGLSLDVIDTNPRAHALYARHGFRDLRRQRAWPLNRLLGFAYATRMRSDLGPA